MQSGKPDWDGCDQCGLCCRVIGLATSVFSEAVDLDRGDGVCKHLTDDNLCEIYRNRPWMCDIAVVHKKKYSDKTIEQYHEMCVEGCKTIKRHFGQ